MTKTLSRLPIEDCLSEIIQAVSESTPVVLKAPPGAGKTTAVPPALIHANVAGNGQVLLIQPRRLAARTAARRLASVMNVRLGEQVGYQVRFDNRTSHTTQLIAMTTGVLLRRLQTDPFLEEVSCVILDEFHERSLEMDLVLGMLQRIRMTLRPELKLLVMSATLDPGPIVDFLGDAIAIASEGRSYPVDIRHIDTAPRDYMDKRIAAVLPNVLASSTGHVLVFLPGVGEIRRTHQAIESVRGVNSCHIHELYGDLTSQAQDEVFIESGTRKIILSTNVAETSITIPGVTAVIDSGQARVMRFDPQVGLPKLQLEPISQAAADQRAGRAGRTTPGVCYRLWPITLHRTRRERDLPEIERADFSEAFLTLSAWGERDVFDFPWLTPPSIESVDHAKQLLQKLGALDDDARLTSSGKDMLTIPLHPRLSRFMVEASRLDLVEEAAIAAALLTERDPFRREANQNTNQNLSTTRSVSGCDLLDRVERVQQSPHSEGVRMVKKVADQIIRMTKHPSASFESNPLREQTPEQTEDTKEERFKRALLAAYPDRLARRRQPGSDRGLMVGGRGVRLDANSSVRDGEYFLCIDVDSSGTEANVRSASRIDEAWLDQRLIREYDEPYFHPTLKAVVARRRRYFAGLMLSESPIVCQPGPAVAELLAGQVRTNIDAVFPKKDDSINGFIERVRFLTSQMPELNLPKLDDDAVEEILLTLCQTRTSVAELQQAPWLDHLRGRFDYSQMLLIDKQAPANLSLPSGNSCSVQYSHGKSPWMEVRIQELFGWKETPRVAGGKVPIQLHLLGPNYRPQQITEDLANFWRETYIQIRKELRRRYPKHYWPEDPLTATATRNGLKPRE